MRIYRPELEHRQQVIGYGRGAGRLEVEFREGTREPQISPLRYAPVEMTNLFGIEGVCFQETNSAAALERVAPAVRRTCHLDRRVVQWRDGLNCPRLVGRQLH